MIDELGVERWEEVEAYDDLFGLGYTKPLRNLLKHLFMHLLASAGYSFTWDDLNELPETNGPDEGT